MAKSSSQKTSSPEITPKEEPVTLDKPESPKPFLPASQVDFTFDEITFTTNNEVALLIYKSSKSIPRLHDVRIKGLLEAVWKLLLLSAAGTKVNVVGYNC
ncbi:hypothetical protein Tco_0843761 [Tanacetum coccineum]